MTAKPQTTTEERALDEVERALMPTMQAFLDAGYVRMVNGEYELTDAGKRYADSLTEGGMH